ncbi:unnamed protein product [Rhizoctonia solani]|uniref:C2H2-type domain-containing protein n=1 Tax=Rhizoctonia solani TaxID=456999 RepID=A0A8H3CZG4_9AGAM|nr:unnamed protein product [Rhizoctonia solani]
MATVHNCRWEWCRDVFSNHADLVDHVKIHMMRGRPITRKKASEILRTEGYNPEEIAVRLIPDYTLPSSFVDDTTSQLLGKSKPEDPSRPAAHSPTIEPNPLPASPPKVSNQDLDMPPSSPPPASPSPPHTPIVHKLENMSIDEPERTQMGAYSDMMVPVSSPPANNTKKDISTPGSTRSSRGKRRSSFIEMSSSPPPDEFSAPRKQPLPESPSVTVMIAEREKRLKEKARERENMMVAERERELRRGADKAEKNQRAGSPPRVRNVIRFGRGRGRGRGRGLTLSTIIPPGTPQTKAPPPLPTPSRPASGSQDTVAKMMSQYTHADSDEDVHANLVENLGGADWGLQTQAPYVPQTQESFGDSEAGGSRGESQSQNTSLGSRRG